MDGRRRRGRVPQADLRALRAGLRWRAGPRVLVRRGALSPAYAGARIGRRLCLPPMLACGRAGAALTAQRFCFDSRPDKACHASVGAGLGAQAMIIENQKDVTTAVLAELQRAPDARFKEIMSAFVRHLHDFVRETKLSEEEFQAAVGYVVALGQHSNEPHNPPAPIARSLRPSPPHYPI